MKRDEEVYFRFQLLKCDDRLLVYYDKENLCVPYVVIEKKKLGSYPKTTSDLLDSEAILFSSEKLATEYFEKQYTQLEGEGK